MTWPLKCRKNIEKTSKKRRKGHRNVENVTTASAPMTNLVFPSTKKYFFFFAIVQLKKFSTLVVCLKSLNLICLDKKIDLP
jgi:hypothetical protein